jgi:hypothetical protein
MKARKLDLSRQEMARPRQQIAARLQVAGVVTLICGLVWSWSAYAAGTWTKVVQDAPGTVQNMILLSDGTVLGSDPGSDIEISTRTWYKLTPDSHGSYINGTWTTIAKMNDSRLDFASVLLRDGRLFVAGGEYGSGRATAEVYDPSADTWTPLPVPANLLDPSQGKGFADASSVILTNGSVMVRPAYPNQAYQTLIYDPNTNGWTNGPTTLAQLGEETWVKLPDSSILTVNPDTTNSERYVPGLPTWISDRDLPATLYESLMGFVGEIGPALLLPDGRAFLLGGTGKTVFYTPSGNNNFGKWAVGPDIPSGLVAADSSAAMMVNGKVLCVAGQPPYVDSGGTPHWPTPISFFEFDYTEPGFTAVNGPTGPTDNVATYKTMMLALPDGNILYSHHNNQLYVYQPDGAPLPAWKPTISSVSWNTDGTLHLTGTQLNGLSQGSSYGDDAQMDSNYPLVRLTDSGGFVLYARTFNWSSTGVMTGNRVVSTEVALSPYLSAGPYSLVVVANGISSDPVTFNEPIWVDFTYLGSLQFGNYELPFQTLAQGVSAVSPGGTILIKTAGSSPETMTITKPMVIGAIGGPATIGQ